MNGRSIALASLFLFACSGSGDDGPDANGMDASAMDASGEDGGVTDAGSDAVQIGTGVDRYEPITEGQTVEIILGPQGGGRTGGFHVWHSVRTKGFDPERITLLFQTFLASNGAKLAESERRANLQPDGDGHIAYGVAPPFADCCLAEDQDIIMSVRVTDANGMTGEDQRTVHATFCRDASGVSVCP